jgi:hypothetical protein
MQEELIQLMDLTNHRLPPVTQGNVPEQSFDSTNDTKEVQVHPTNPKKTALISTTMSSA